MHQQDTATQIRQLTAEAQQLRRLADTLLGGPVVDDAIGGVIDNAGAIVERGLLVAIALLEDRGRADAKPAIKAAFVSATGQAITEAVVHLHLTKEIGTRPYLVSAVVATGMAVPRPERPAIAANLKALIALDREELVVLASVCGDVANDEAWRSRHGYLLAGPSRVERLARLASIGLVAGEQATETGRVLLRALAKVCA